MAIIWETTIQIRSGGILTLKTWIIRQCYDCEQISCRDIDPDAAFLLA